MIAVAATACSSTTAPTPPPATAPEPSARPVPSTSGSEATAIESRQPSAASPVSSGPASSTGPAPAIDPSNFVSAVDNPWFPLKTGTSATYQGIKDGEKAIDTSSVTGETRVVAGVTCVVVRDQLTLGGKLAERTEDWYVQDRQGNVWYFGEATAELDDAGTVISTEGSWESGVSGAQPGIFMPADPVVGYSQSQEYLAGHAEDHFVVLLTGQKARVPAGAYGGVLVTGEWTPLEPAVFTEKAYVKGLGEIREADVVGGDEKLELVKISGT